MTREARVGDSCTEANQCTSECGKRSSRAFEVLPRRWVVERTFTWLLENRPLVVDSEKLPEISEAPIRIAMARLMLKRLALHIERS